MVIDLSVGTCRVPESAATGVERSVVIAARLPDRRTSPASAARREARTANAHRGHATVALRAITGQWQPPAQKAGEWFMSTRCTNSWTIT